LHLDLYADAIGPSADARIEGLVPDWWVVHPKPKLRYQVGSENRLCNHPSDAALRENVMIMGNNAANDAYTLRCKAEGLKVHPARYPRALPEFFVKMLTDEGDIVLDPFAGSNTTGAVAEALGRRWISLENVQEYVEASKFRFPTVR
jgi:DNA modification methylase